MPARVKIDTSAFRRLQDRLRGRAIRAAADQVEADLDKAVTAAKRSWGVETGRGRKSLEVEGSSRGIEFEIEVRSTYLPVRYQRPGNTGDTYWERLVAAPLRRARREIAERAGRRLARALKQQG